MHFENLCHHEPDEFVATIEHDGKMYDVYVWSQPNDPVPQVCIRYSDEGADYISVGSIGQLKHTLELHAVSKSAYRHTGVYAKALEAILNKKGVK